MQDLRFRSLLQDILSMESQPTAAVSQLVPLCISITRFGAENSSLAHEARSEGEVPAELVLSGLQLGALLHVISIFLEGPTQLPPSWCFYWLNTAGSDLGVHSALSLIALWEKSEVVLPKGYATQLIIYLHSFIHRKRVQAVWKRLYERPDWPAQRQLASLMNSRSSDWQASR